MYMKCIAIFGNAMQLYYASIYPCCTKIVLYILTDLIGWFTLITVYNKCVYLSAYAPFIVMPVYKYTWLIQ